MSPTVRGRSALGDLLVGAGGSRECLDGCDARVRANIERLVDSCLQRGNLSKTGQHILGRVALRHLRNHLGLAAHRRVRPLSDQTALASPIVITGLPRTGTTLLHQLLAADPTHRALRLWEALNPVAASSPPSCAELKARATTWLERFDQLVPAFRSIHPLSVEGPEECDALFQNSFASQHFEDMFDAPAYSTWLGEADLSWEYSDYRAQLLMLDGGSERRTWVLKSPSHLGHLKELLDTLPGSTVVHCHRQADQAIASYASLVRAVRQPNTKFLDPVGLGRHALERCARAITRALAVRDHTGPGTFVDVDYRRLAADPLATVREIYRARGKNLEGPAETAMRRWLAQNPRQGREPHRYSLEQFGLDRDEVKATLVAYVDRFGQAVTG